MEHIHFLKKKLSNILKNNFYFVFRFFSIKFVKKIS